LDALHGCADGGWHLTMGWVLALVALVLLAAVLYWQLILAEGAYLGRRVVIALYNWSARVYDRIKSYDIGYEQWFLARPLSSALFAFPDPFILDVATGTARLARTLFREVGFRGRLVGLDLSRGMLEQAALKTHSWSDRMMLVWQDASTLPFADNTFEAVACLEALEFVPDADAVLREMVRVLRPGGIFLTTNRIGKDARWLPGRTQSESEFEARLKALSLEMVKTRPWQEDYDLIWALKPGVCAPLNLRRLQETLRCPICHTKLTCEPDRWSCESGHNGRIAPDGIIEMTKIQSS